MLNKVVVHYLDGRVQKGVTLDFVPNKETFHLSDFADEKKVTQVTTRALKAVFFVRSFAGNPNRERPVRPADLPRAARTLRVTFRDGEVLDGTCTVYSREREGFFLVPNDPGDNNERVYIFAHATVSVEAVKPVAV